MPKLATLLLTQIVHKKLGTSSYAIFRWSKEISLLRNVLRAFLETSLSSLMYVILHVTKVFQKQQRRERLFRPRPCIKGYSKHKTYYFLFKRSFLRSKERFYIYVLSFFFFSSSSSLIFVLKGYWRVSKGI